METTCEIYNIDDYRTPTRPPEPPTTPGGAQIIPINIWKKVA